MYETNMNVHRRYLKTPKFQQEREINQLIQFDAI
jgi:hypothetical protein